MTWHLLVVKELQTDSLGFQGVLQPVRGEYFNLMAMFFNHKTFWDSLQFTIASLAPFYSLGTTMAPDTKRVSIEKEWRLILARNDSTSPFKSDSN